MRKLFFMVALSLVILTDAQTKQNLSKDLTQDDSTALVTIASYPDSIRPSIVLACQKPDFLVQTEALQKNTSQSFRSLIDGYSKEEQGRFWNLTRYPGLISRITTGEKKSKEELELIAALYPQEIRSDIVEVGKKHYDVLVNINSLNTKSDADFEKIIADYPYEQKTIYRSMLNHPDVLNTLATNMHLSVILGNMYNSDPQQTSLMLDAIREEQVKQNQKDKEDWKNGLEKDPEAKKEMEEAGKEFVKDKDSDSNVDDVYNTSSYNSTPQTLTTQPVLNTAVYPYPYWYGYPWWYNYPNWYPYPYWYNLGFYWGPMGIVYYGCPSPFFMSWYFYHPYHHYNYSHFTNYCLGYRDSHYGPRNQRTGFNNVIQGWARTNQPNLPRGYLNADANRQSRIKELGKFEMNYHDNTKGIFGRNITRPEFLQNNSTYYPHLAPAIKQPSFNQPIRYPAQQNPLRFNMGRSGGFSSQPMQRSGGGAVRGRR